MATTAAIIGLGAAVGSTVVGIQQQRKAAHFQRADNALKQQEAAAINLRNRQDTYRNYLRSRASISQGAANQGALDTSGFSGSTGSLASQTASSIGFSGQREAIATSRYQAATAASVAQSRLSLIGAGFNLIGQGASLGMKFGGTPDTTSTPDTTNTPTSTNQTIDPNANIFDISNSSNW